MSNGYTTRRGNVRYAADHNGVREFGLSKGVQRAAVVGADAVAHVASALDPDGGYSTRGVITWVGKRNEPRQVGVVEGSWYPGARTAALKRAITQAGQGIS